MFLSELLHPVNPVQFRDKILGKKHYYWKAPSGASERYSDLYSWKKFDSYLNDWRNANHVQLAEINEEGNPTYNSKWDKGRDGTLSKSQVYNYWRHGYSIVLPFCEYQSQSMWSIVNTMERAMPFGPGCANMYCSSRTNAKTFTPHRDTTENFLFHIDGQVKWRFYREDINGDMKVFDDIILGRGDLLYIPIGLMHDTQPLGPRLTASIHFQKDPKKIKGGTGREKMYDWWRWFEFQKEVKI